MLVIVKGSFGCGKIGGESMEFLQIKTSIVQFRVVCGALRLLFSFKRVVKASSFGRYLEFSVSKISKNLDFMSPVSMQNFHF